VESRFLVSSFCLKICPDPLGNLNGIDQRDQPFKLASSLQREFSSAASEIENEMYCSSESNLRNGIGVSNIKKRWTKKC
jgi:protein tyrosine/serine phosphatase